jgi:hypothetical protein
MEHCQSPAFPWTAFLSLAGKDGVGVTFEH